MRRRTDKLDTGARITGNFEVEPGRAVFGELTLEEDRTRLFLRDDDFFHTLALPDDYLKGQAHDMSCVSLFNCITMSGPGSASSGKQSYTFADVFPHHVVQGPRHLSPREKGIRSASFTIDDGHALFYDFDALGVVIDAKPLIDVVANANRKVTRRKPLIGERPRIHFHLGRSDLLAAKTAYGKVNVTNLISETIGSPKRVALESRIGFHISWSPRADLETALIAIDAMTRFLELMVGRPQNLHGLLLEIPRDDSTCHLNIYSSMANRWRRSGNERMPGPHDVLIDGVRRRAELSKVLERWLALEDQRRDARLSFANAFRKGNRFSEDRLIAAANMFDLLPRDAVPRKASLNKELVEARNKVRTIFAALADSPERDSMLSAIGRLGTASLPKKVLHRAKIVTDMIPELADDMAFVVREAVKCRNHYVHGSDASFDYRADDAISFFTNTLEFLFGASDLIECGWTIGKSPVGDHPFSELLRSWSQRVRSLRANVEAAKKT